MPIHWSVWAIKPGKKGFAKRYPPGSYPAADVLKCSLMNAHRDDPDVYFFLIKERTPLASSGQSGAGTAGGASRDRRADVHRRRLAMLAEAPD